MKARPFWLTIAAAVVIAAGVVGCAKERVKTVSYVGLQNAQIGQMAVMPFFVGRHPNNLQETMNCKLCLLSFNPEDVLRGADETLTRYLRKAMRTRYEGRVLAQAEVLQRYAEIAKDRDRDTPVSLARKLGKALNTDFILLGTVWRYRERVGSPGGATSPASVAFDVYLLDVSSGKLLWMASFDETQRSLSENVLDIKAFFSRGAKWLSANELASYGVDEIVKSFPL